MKCYKCGAEMVDGAMFCGNCGARMEDAPATPPENKKPAAENNAVEYQETEAAKSTETEIISGTVEESIFCPNCGKRLTAEDIFCDECGYRLSGDGDMGGGDAGGSSDSGEKKKLNLRKILIPIGAIAVIAVAVGIGSVVFSRIGKLGGGSEKVSNKLFYVKDDAMMMVDLSKKKATPVELTGKYTKNGNYSRTGILGGSTNLISENEKTIYYMEDRTSEDYDLYQAKMSKPTEGTKIESKISGHRVLKDNTIMYRKKSSLYRYNGKESVRFGKDVESYFLDEDQKYVCWIESDKGESTYYLQDIAQKKDKVKLEDDVDNFYYKNDFSAFYVLKDDNLYVIDRSGEKERIAKDVEDIVGFNRDTGKFYYTKDNAQEIAYIDFVYDDNKEMDEYSKERLKENEHTFEVKELYLYDSKGEHQITDRYLGRHSFSLSDDGQYILYKECPNLEELEVPWSEVSDQGLESATIQAVNEASLLVLATDAETKTEISLEDRTIANSLYGKDDNKLYLYTVDEDGEDGVIYETSTKGSKAGELEEYDTDAEDAQLLLAVKGGLYYLKDYEEGGGDLYYNGKEILSDVASISRLGDSDKIVVLADYDYDDSTYTVSLWNGKKNTQMSEDVNEVECASNGTAVFLVEYNYSRGEGDLVYFNGKEARTVDEDVTGFFERKKSDS